MKNCFYKEKSAIIITGATGIIGQSLAKQFAVNIHENSTLLLSSRNKLRLKNLKDEILKLRSNIRVETVVWNLESPNYDTFFSDIKQAFPPNYLSNNNNPQNCITSYFTAVLIHNATDVGDIDKTVIEHGQNPKRIQEVLNINVVSLISLTSAFVKYFNYFKCKKIVVEMISSTSKYSFPSFGHLSLKCACKMVLDILLQEEDGKLKVLYYNPVAVDTENLRKIKNFSNDESIKEAFDILYKSKKLYNPNDISKHLFNLINDNNFHNGSIISFGEENNNNNDIDESFDITTQIKPYDFNFKEKISNNKIIKKSNDQTIRIANINLSKNSELFKNENYTSNKRTTSPKKNDNVKKNILIDKLDQECCSPSNVSQIEKYLNMIKKNSINIIKNGQLDYFQQTHKIINDNIIDSIDYSNNINTNLPTSHSKTSKDTIKKKIKNGEFNKIEVSKPKTLYQEYKDIYFEENFHPTSKCVVPNTSSFKIIKSFYNKNKSQNSNCCHESDKTPDKLLEIEKINLNKDTYKSTNKVLNENEVLKNMKTDDIERKVFLNKEYQDTKMLVENEKIQTKLKSCISKKSTPDNKIVKENEDTTFLVKRIGQNKIYIINGVIYNTEGAYKHYSCLQ